MILALAAIVGLAVPASAQTTKPPCQGALSFVTCNGVVSGVANTIGGVASGNPAPAVTGAVQIGGAGVRFGQTAAANWMKGRVADVANAIGDAIGKAASSITHELDGATIPSNFPSWFMDSWGLTRNLGFEILFLCYVIAIIIGVLKANLARVVQTPLLAAAAIGGMFATLVIVSVFVQTVDWASSLILHGSSANITTVMHSFGSLILLSVITGPQSSVFVTFLLLILILVAFAIVWFNLLVRKWIIYIATGMFALALSGSLTKAGAKWLKFLAVLLGTVIVSKLLLVVILSYGVSALAQPSSASDVAGGGAVFLLSGLAPWVLVGIVFSGMHVLHGGTSAAGEPARMGRDAARSARRTHNHWQTARRNHTEASHEAIKVRGKAAANSVFEAQVSAAARSAAVGGSVAAGVATAGATVAASAAKKAAAGAKRAPAKITGTPPPTGTTQTKSGLLLPKPGSSPAGLKTAAGPRPSGINPRLSQAPQPKGIKP
jgi:hypothetical protein